MKQETIQTIKERLKRNPSIEDLVRWGADERRGVQKLLESYNRVAEQYQKEKKRLQELYRFEADGYRIGYKHIAGTDEAGRGPVAGPVTISAVILPAYWQCEGLNDSKKLSASRRVELFDKIRRDAISYAIVHVSPVEIDEMNIYQAVQYGMMSAIKQLSTQPDYVLTDAMPLPMEIPVKSLVRGDALSASIAAASILAKVSRDKLMEVYAQEYPEYGFEVHKGYLTELHRENIKKYGPSPIHRRTFEPIKSIVSGK